MDEDKSSAETSAGAAAGSAIAAGGVASVAAVTLSDMTSSNGTPFGSGLDVFTDELGITFEKPNAAITLVQASRFLAQATCGATRGEIDRVSNIGVNAWLDDQFTIARGQTHWDWLKARKADADPEYAKNGRGKSFWDNSAWRQLVISPDQLRQRVGLALLDTMVVGIDGLSERWPQFAMAAYMDLLLDNAFGNFRELLGAITTSSAMAQYLTYLSSSREDVDGAMPDENYARELMQLFTIGLHALKPNGQVRTSNNNAIPAFSQTDVSQLARVFTGLRLTSNDFSRPDLHRKSLAIDRSLNDSGTIQFLGRSISGGGTDAVQSALDVLFLHDNLPPFFARSMIRRLVTSNPSDVYVGRVAEVFADNGRRVRGDMKAVIRAILTDPEARSDGALVAPHTGKVRDPILRLTGWARAFGVQSKGGKWEVGDLSSSVAGLGQAPGRSPSVFNFFRPGYSPPQSELSRRGLVAPELQIANEQSVIAYINFMAGRIRNGLWRSDMMPNYAWILPLARDARALVNEVNLIMAAGQVSAERLALITQAVESIQLDQEERRLRRVWTAVLLVMASPDYIVLN